VLDLDADFSTAWQPSEPQCFAIIYPVPPDHIWKGYPFINNVHFFADRRVSNILSSHYSLVIKSDFDAFLTPGFVSRQSWKKLTFGRSNALMYEWRVKSISLSPSSLI
jgi:hypothetical protein